MRNAFIDIMTHAKFNFNQLMLTLIFGIQAWRTTEKAEPDRVNDFGQTFNPILPGGGAYFTPLRFFCSTVQTATAIAMIFGDF